jgi:hypothetical protein
VRIVYEAGPMWLRVATQMTTARMSCEVVAPALIPRKPGERVKTNRRDARKLAELGACRVADHRAAADTRGGSRSGFGTRALMLARTCSGVGTRLGKLLLRRGLDW